ncbi:MAG TPA: ATP-dependent Clp protease ATP-binding subunit ClpC [Clostridiales bacterium]|nr:ATP-dependent Clp protease ATP-binding subunit ClpC [Clostridiales bacterium]
MYSNLRFTESADLALQYAGSIALQYGSYTIDTEHILYGLTMIKDSVASKILKNYGITSSSLENVFAKIYKNSSTLIANEVDLSIDSKEAILIASQFASQIGHDFVGTEHLLIAILLGENYDAGSIIKRYFRANINDIKNSVLQVLKSKAMGMPQDNYSNYSDMGTMQNSNFSGNSAELPEFMSSMGRDLTAKAREGKIDPIIGRKEEIERVIEILCRKNKNNPVLIGEAGVGKSAVVDGLALAIASGNVPDLLKNKTIFSLELGGLMAGTKYRGELEERLKQVIDYITNNKDIIVFIDEIHTLVQVGGDKGEVNPADMLKPYLARGEFQTIGATTTEEYRKYIEKDKALERRFQPVMVNPPTVEQTIEILRGLKDSFEVFHKVKISDDAIVAAASLSDRYIMDRSLPDKAIDLIDEASSKVKVNGRKKPEELKELEEQISKYEAEKKEALFAENFEKAGQFRDKIREAQEKIKQISNSDVANSDDLTITQEDICNIVSEWTKIPVSKITENERERLLKLEEILHKRVIGQDEAVRAVSKAIRRARIGLKDNNRPIGSFMFLGQTGVGKTELCKALAEAMFDNENAVIRLDMSEYMEKHSVSKLIGSPPGYVGFDEGGQLTEKVRRKPYSVILFDEIEKAHPDVFNILLQVLDDGRLTDSQGRTVSFKNTIIIFTSNVGVNELPKKKGGLGFGDGNDDKTLDYDEIKEILMNALKRQFKPEFLNRIDVVTVFHPLNYEQLSQIAKLFISNLNKRLLSRGANLKVTESALKYLIDKGYDSEYGARPLRRLIEQEIEDKIAEQILEGTIPEKSTIIISAKDGKLNFKVSPQEN